MNPRGLGVVGLALAAGLFFSVPGARAQSHLIFGGDDVSHQDTLGVLLGYGFPLNPLRPGVGELKVVPAYLTLDNTFAGPEELSGAGFAASYTRGLTDHWGVSVLASYGYLKGDVLGMQERAGPAGFQASTDFSSGAGGAVQSEGTIEKKGYGLQGAVALVYDPFTSPEGFRLPIMFGVGGMLLDHEAAGTLRSTNLAADLDIKVARKELIPGAFVGASAQFNTGPFRWVPFFAVQFALSSGDGQEVEVRNSGTGVLLFSDPGKGAESFFPSVGLGVQYRPWGLTFTWNPSIHRIVGGSEEPNPRVLSLSKSFRFGE